MRTLAIGDIHGCSRALNTLLALIAPKRQDRLIALGDFVDRGPDSCGVLNRLLELHEAGLLVPLLGNHDEMMLRSRTEITYQRMWLRYGGIETLRSYGHWPRDETYDRVPPSHWLFLESSCRAWYETETHLFAHACVRPDLAMHDQDEDGLRWTKLVGPIAHRSGKTLICGHTLQDSGLPLDLGTTVCIDTGVYQMTGWLTCLHVEAGYYWQANEFGQSRQGTLAELQQLDQARRGLTENGPATPE